MNIIEQIRDSRDITLPQLQLLLTTHNEAALHQLRASAFEVKQQVYGNKIFMRGLIEISSYCRNNCYYCGLRRDNATASRYRLTPQQIYSCCQAGYELGFRTFVLQGGEDMWFNDERMVEIVSHIHECFPDCAITLSLGERSYESYLKLYEAGAERYLLRHETASQEHYGQLHPQEMSFQNRLECLRNLKNIGYQVGCGFMVGSPYQTVETLFQDLQYIRMTQPQMVGIGPFIPAHDTPFAAIEAGSVEQTLRLLAIIRLLHPHVLLPATTALATLHSKGREMAIASGANVIMPNLSPVEHRAKYSIYDNKCATGTEAAEGVRNIRERISEIGSDAVIDRGDFRK